MLYSPIKLAILTALLASSCASRSLSAGIPPAAPSSAKAKEAPLMPVTLSLERDPPSGEATTSTVSPHHHHHGGHHHGH